MSGTDQRIEDLAKRVARLESANRLIKIFGLIAFGSLVAVMRIPVTSAMPTFPSVTTQLLNLVSPSGQVLASLAPSTGGAALTFYDSGGNQTVSVGMGPIAGRAGLAVFDGNSFISGNGIVRGQWGISNPSQPAEQFFDVNGFTRALMAASGADGGWGFSFYDEQGHKLTQVGEQNSGTGAGLAVFDGNKFAAGTGVGRAGFGIAGSSAAIPGGGFGMRVYDPNAQLRVGIGTPLDASVAGASIYDANGLNGAVTGIDDDPAHNFRGFFVNEASGKNRIAAGEITSDTSAGFFVKDTNGTLRGDVGINGAGSAAAHSVYDVNGKLEDRLYGKADHSQEQLIFLDAAGNVIWFAPEPAGQ